MAPRAPPDERPVRIGSILTVCSGYGIILDGVTSALLPRSAPSAQGVSPSGVLGFLDAVEAAGLDLHSIMLVRHGHVVAEGWWAPYRADRTHLLYSLSKSFTSSAIGIAQAEGLL